MDWYRVSMALPAKSGEYEVTYQSYVDGGRHLGVATWEGIWIDEPPAHCEIIAWRVRSPYEGER